MNKQGLDKFAADLCGTASAPRDFYAGGVALCEKALAHLDKRDAHLANARLLVAAVGMGYAWAAWRGWPWWGLVVPVALFSALAVVHGLYRLMLRAVGQMLAVMQEGLARVEGRWAGKGRGGEGLAPAHHPYAEDLDIFGVGSLFELMNTCRTRVGEERLAAWLLHGAPAHDAAARQEAVRELASVEKRMLRVAMAALGRPQRVDASRENFEGWARTKDQFHGVGWAIWCIVNAVLLAMGVVGAYLAGIYTPLIIQFAVNLIALGFLKQRSAALEAWAEASGRQWKALAEAMEALESEKFASVHLEGLRAKVWHPSRASKAFKKLDGLVWMLQMPLNQFFMPIAVLTLWPIVFGMAVERWRRRFGPHFGEWLDAFAEYEALCAVATFAHDNPDYVYPEWREEAVLDAERLAHPLLPRATRIANDVHLGPGQRLLVLSGSNMSGKSTLLRSMGINAVLAMAGAPVCARRLALSPLAVGATMRVHDSIQEGASRFYAEVLRLKQLLDLARGDRKLLFLCDEILHGTNSHDRAEGARAVMQAFQAAGAIGVMSTHDLALTAMAAELDEAVNVHLQDEFDGEKIVFDYTLRPGVVGKSNALALMRGAGLPV